MTNLYLPDGSRVEVADDAVDTVLAESPDLKRVNDWRASNGSRHPDAFPQGHDLGGFDPVTGAPFLTP